MSLRTTLFGSAQPVDGQFRFSGAWALSAQGQVEQALTDLVQRVDALEREVAELRRDS